MTKKEQFISKWSCWWIGEKRAEELTKAFERELDEVISNNVKSVSMAHSFDTGDTCIKCGAKMIR